MNNLSLYQITSAFPSLMENDEINEEDKKQIEQELTLLLQQKSQNIIGYFRNIELTINAMKEEENRIATGRKSLENRLSKFKQYVKECMESNNIKKIETGLGTLSIAQNQQLHHLIINQRQFGLEIQEQNIIVKIVGL